MATDWVNRLGSPPCESNKNNCEPPSRLKVTATVRPSGDHEGALLDPLKLARTRLLPEDTSCTYTTGLRDSKDT